LNKYSNGFITIISAPSGAGKTSICNKIIEYGKGHIVFSRSCTTRKRRPNENPEAYYFISEEEFKKNINEGKFIEWAKVHGNYYGTLKKTIDDLLKNNKIVLLDIDVQGAQQIRQIYPDSLFIFIMPPSLKILKERLVKRGTDNLDTILTRLKNAKKELQYLKYYDYIVVNEDLEEASKDVFEIIKSFSYKKINYKKEFLNKIKQEEI